MLCVWEGWNSEMKKNLLLQTQSCTLFQTLNISPSQSEHNLFILNFFHRSLALGDTGFLFLLMIGWGDLVAQSVERWTFDCNVAGSNPRLDGPMRLFP